MAFFVLGFYMIISLIPQCSMNVLPSYLPHCSITDPKIGKCLLSASKAVRSNIRKGIKELGIPSYQPLILPNFYVNGTSDMANYTSAFWNYTIRGMDNYDITDIQYDPNTKTFRGTIEFDPLSITSRYIFNGNLLSIPIIGNGIVDAALGPINGTFEITGRMTKRKKREYYEPTGVSVKLIIDDISLQIGGLFDGDVEQAAMTNELVNRSSKMIAEVLTPVFEKLGEVYILRYLKWLTRKFPFNKLFPRS